MRYKQAIQIGDNVTDIMKLPCVMECHKRDIFRGGHRIEFYYVLDSRRMKAPGWQFGHEGDWLCEDYDGRWHLLTDKEYKDGLEYREQCAGA